MQLFFLLTGSTILLAAMYDFFITTLSASGTSSIAKFTFSVGHKFTKAGVRVIGRSFLKYSGLIINLSTLTAWLLMFWFGLFLIFTSQPEAITNASGRVASHWERLYFTGYTLSTLGLGNFKPTTAFFEILTSCFSFLGFIFFTSSVTYFLSLFSGIMNKRVLARGINGLGKNPEQIASRLGESDSPVLAIQLVNFVEKIDQHIVNHQAYPVIHYINHPDEEEALTLNIARLDEAINILTEKRKGNLPSELGPLRNALDSYLYKMEQDFSSSSSASKDLPSFLVPASKLNGTEPGELERRRRILGTLLEGAGYNWDDTVGKS